MLSARSKMFVITSIFTIIRRSQRHVDIKPLSFISWKGPFNCRINDRFGVLKSFLRFVSLFTSFIKHLCQSWCHVGMLNVVEEDKTTVSIVIMMTNNLNDGYRMKSFDNKAVSNCGVFSREPSVFAYKKLSKFVSSRAYRPVSCLTWPNPS